MSRVEDNEAERAERLVQERKLQDKAVEQKRIGEARQFSNVVAQMQQTRGQNARQDEHKEQQKQAASRNIMARNGIASNDTSKSNLDRSNALSDKERSRLLQKAGERARQDETLAAGERPKSTVSGETRAVGGSSKQGKQDRSQGGQDDPRSKAAKEERPTQANAFAQVHATANAIDGVGARASSLAGGVPMNLTAKEVIDHIVSHVRAGMDSKGFGLIQINLRDDILAGSTLTFLSSQNGVHLKVDTGDQDVERLLSSGQTAHELSVAMQRAEIKLTGLEVNGSRVLG